MGSGKCPQSHKVGEVFNYPEDLGKLCPTATHVLYPSTTLTSHVKLNLFQIIGMIQKIKPRH